MSKITDWTPTRTGAPLPPDGALCEVITPGGDQRNLIWDNGLWWLPDRSMYVYFIPDYWRPA